jgi:hypothetical protein
MPETRSKVIYACQALTDSCWLYAAIGIVGLMFGQGGPPLPWLAVLAVLTVGMYVGWLTMGMRGNPASLAILLGGVGLACVYLIVAAGDWRATSGYDLAWPARFTGGDMTPRQWAGALVSLVAAVLLWRRAVDLAADRYIEERLQRSFKLGMAVMAIAVLAEQASGSVLGARTLLVPFFGASLAGMAVARLPEQGAGAKARAWARTIAVSVLGVIGLGLLLGLAGGVYGASGVHLLYRGWGLLVDGVLWLLRFPLQLLVNGMLAFWGWIRDLLNPSGERTRLDPISVPQPPPPFGSSTAEQGQSLAEQVINILQYPLLVLLLVGIFLLLALVFRRMWRRTTKPTDEDREKMDGEVDASADLAALLKSLLPAWLRRKGDSRPLWRYPEGEPGTAEVFLLYFDYLSEGMRRGMRFDASVTPIERAPALAAALPGAPVTRVTERFNAACYGREGTDPATVDELRAGLNREGRG